jgi:hypothetical protein
MALSRLLAKATVVIAFVAAPVVADGSHDNPENIEHTVQPQTGIESWKLRDHGVEFMLMQIAPDQARGFFLARGFVRKDVDYYASSCVFATVVTNRAPSSISYRLADWRYTSKDDGVARKLKLKDDWLREWKQRSVSSSAQIAFEWSQHPVEQTLEPGDWNQGMTTYLVPHGSRFDLTVKWKMEKVNYEETIKDIRCAD